MTDLEDLEMASRKAASVLVFFTPVFIISAVFFSINHSNATSYVNNLCMYIC